jgi:C4-dicarboxylate-specific signal transduction histidine kinase
MRAAHVIRRIRAFARRAADQGPLDINDAIREVLAFTRSELLQQQISVRAELDPDVPTVLGDRVQLQQVVLNLVMNSIEAMSAVTDRPRVLRITSRAHGSSSVLVAVEDSGTGIDAGTMNHIFQPFFTTKSEGLGMGLPICRSIVDAHGGRLWASHGSLDGAVLQFTIPTTGDSGSADHPA